MKTINLTSLSLCPHYHSAWQWLGFEDRKLRCKSVIVTFTLPIELNIDEQLRNDKTSLQTVIYLKLDNPLNPLSRT